MKKSSLESQTCRPAPSVAGKRCFDGTAHKVPRRGLHSREAPTSSAIETGSCADPATRFTQPLSQKTAAPRLLRKGVQFAPDKKEVKREERGDEGGPNGPFCSSTLVLLTQSVDDGVPVVLPLGAAPCAAASAAVPARVRRLHVGAPARPLLGDDLREAIRRRFNF